MSFHPNLLATRRLPTAAPGAAPTALLLSALLAVLANNAVIGLAFSGSGTLALNAATAGPVHVLIDVCGYFE